eukprot:g10252.t1
MLLVIESGLAVDIQDIWRFGARASLAAATGVLMPTLLSFALYSGVLGVGWKAALAVGAALSPTSLGFSAQLLGEVGQLSTPIGQLICTAAVIDDVLSLLLLAEVQALGDDNPKWFDYAVPILASVGSVMVGSLAAVFISSKTETLGAWLSSLNDGGAPCEQSLTAEGAVKRHQQDHLSPKKQSTDTAIGRGPADVEMTRTPLQAGAAATTTTSTTTLVEASRDGGDKSPGLVGRGDRVLLAMVLAFALFFAYLSSLVGSSDLLGCFLGGLAFSGVPDVQRVWARQMKRYSQWGARLFFSATVAFSVPSIHKDGGLLRLKPFWKGLVLTSAAVAGKLVVGLYAGPPLTLSDFLKLGWAMNGRGEFSFFIAQEASDEGILTTEDYSAVVWALLLSSFAAPVFFRRVLTKQDYTVDSTNGSACGDLCASDHSRGREQEGARGSAVTAVVR